MRLCRQKGAAIAPDEVINCGMRLHHLPSSVAALTLAILVTGCKPTVSHDEVARAWSPNGQIAATLFEENGGATTSFGYEVEMSSKDGSEPKPVARMYGSQRNEGAYGANLRWESNNILVIECLKTKTPPTISGPVSLEGQIVKVMLRTGIEDEEAPAGGMKFNLHRNAP